MVQIAVIARRQNLPRDTIEVTPALFMRQLRVTLPAIFAPVILIGGMVVGWFGATEAAGVTVVYALLVGVLFYRKLLGIACRGLPRDSALFRGSAVHRRLRRAVRLGAHDRPGADARRRIPAGLSKDPLVLLLIVNLLLLGVGMIMESIAAILSSRRSSRRR